MAALRPEAGRGNCRHVQQALRTAEALHSRRSASRMKRRGCLAGTDGPGIGRFDAQARGQSRAVARHPPASTRAAFAPTCVHAAVARGPATRERADSSQPVQRSRAFESRHRHVAALHATGRRRRIHISTAAAKNSVPRRCRHDRHAASAADPGRRPLRHNPADPAAWHRAGADRS